MCRIVASEPSRLWTSARGYTFVELMVVLLILGVTSSFAIPSYRDYTVRARVSEVFPLTAGPRDTIGAYFSHRGTFPANNAAAGLPPPKNIIGRYVLRTEVENGAIHLQLRLPGGLDRQGERVLSFRPAVMKSAAQTSAIVWLCGYAQPSAPQSVASINRTNVSRRVLPSACL